LETQALFVPAARAYTTVMIRRAFELQTYREHLTSASLAVAVGALASSLAGCSPETSQGTRRPPAALAANTPSQAATPPLVAPKPHRAEKAMVTEQRNLNHQLLSYGMPALDLDGKAGGQTSRALCALRLFTGHPASKAAASPFELRALQHSQVLHSPLPGFVISRTCQVMGINIDHRLSMIIPVSTGAPGGHFSLSPRDHTTNPGNFHIMSGYYGWHNSTLYPSKHTAGNMLNTGFFNGDQGIHGSDEMLPAVTSPESHGCVRYETKYAAKIWSLLGGPTNLPNDAYVAQLRPVPVEVL
jgi:hypothetical protein